MCGDCTISKLSEPSSIEQNKHYKRERVSCLFLTKSSLHRIASDLDVKNHCMDEFLDDVKSYNTNRNLLLHKIIMLLTIAKVQMLNKPYSS
jgi:hypothetical protein